MRHKFWLWEHILPLKVETFIILTQHNRKQWRTKGKICFYYLECLADHGHALDVTFLALRRTAFLLLDGSCKRTCGLRVSSFTVWTVWARHSLRNQGCYFCPFFFFCSYSGCVQCEQSVSLKVISHSVNKRNDSRNMQTHEMASIMSTPISTQQWAWSALGSGKPDTQ